MTPDRVRNVGVRTERPGSAEESAAVLARCAGERLTVRFRGGGTKLAWGATAPDPDVDLSTAALAGVVEHNVGDLTAIVRAGTPLAEAQAVFGTAGQHLALDPPDGAGATLGGVLATADSGPLRHRYGGIRDLVLGVQVALSDGTVARAGGKVIKNVAGYDLGKLFTGSYGTLGLVVELAVRLHPRPARTGTAIGRTGDPDALAAAARTLAQAPLEAECLDVSWGGPAPASGALLARFGSADPGARVAEAAALLAADGLDVEVVDDGDDGRWAAQRAGQRSPDGVVVKVSAVPTDLPLVIRAAQALSAGVVGRAGWGLSYVTVPPAPAADLVAAVAELRTRLPGRPCVVLDAPAEVRAALDPWGVETGPVPLMRRVKERFDPAGICRPGVFVGGI